VINRD